MIEQEGKQLKEADVSNDRCRKGITAYCRREGGPYQIGRRGGMAH